MKKRVLSILLALAMMCLLVPSTVFAADDMHEDFYVLLNSNGDLELNYVNPGLTSSPDAMLNAIYQYIYDLCYENEIAVRPDSFNDDYSKLTLSIYEASEDEFGNEISVPVETHTVDVVYNYAPAILEVANGIIEKFPENKTEFELTDLEMLNYLRGLNKAKANETEENYITISGYSSELKSYLEYSNFTTNTGVGAGGGSLFYIGEMGDTFLMNNGVAYGAIPFLEFIAKYVIYVPESTADTPEALAAAAQERIDSYLGNGVVEVSYDENLGTIADFYNGEVADFDRQYEATEETLALERANLQSYQEAYDAATSNEERDRYSSMMARSQSMIMGYENELEYILIYKENFIKSFEEGGNYEFLGDAAGEDGLIFKLSFKDTGFNVNFVIIKDDSKIAVEAPACKSVDMFTDIQVETSDPSVPLDTVITAEKLTSGEDYNKIVKTLDVETSVSYDINLYSETLNDNITKLENGTFKVSLPIPAELEGKDLIVYYVDDDGNVTDYEVDPKGKFATFETDHFSIYTLAEVKKVDVGTGTDTGEVVPQPKPEEKPQEEVIANTADTTEFMPWMVTMVAATLGCGYVASKRKEFE